MDTCIDSADAFNSDATALCLSKTFVRHHDALLPYAVDAIEAIIESSSVPGARPIEYDAYLAAATVLLGDPSLCAKQSLPALRVSCAAALAQIDDDPRRCETLADPLEAMRCVGSYIEIDPGDVGDCRSLGDVDIDDEDMGRVTGADFCLGAAARLNETPGLCREIENVEVRSMCIMGSMMSPPAGWADVGICDEIVGINLNDPDEQYGVTSPEGLREICSVMAAAAAMASPQALAMCEEVEHPTMRDVCFMGAASKQKNGAYCDHIVSEPVRKVCRHAAAEQWSEATQAEADAFVDELLDAIGESDTPDQVAEGHFADAPVCTTLLHEPVDCTLYENRVTLELRGDTGDFRGTGTIVGELPMGRVDGTSWAASPDPCPAMTARARATIRLSGGFTGIFSRDTARGPAEIEWDVEEPPSPVEGVRCGTKTLFDDKGQWEATVHDGAIDGVVDFGGGVEIPFMADLKAE
jgi:hypothetical protein